MSMYRRVVSIVIKRPPQYQSVFPVFQSVLEYFHWIKLPPIYRHRVSTWPNWCCCDIHWTVDLPLIRVCTQRLINWPAGPLLAIQNNKEALCQSNPINIIQQNKTLTTFWLLTILDEIYIYYMKKENIFTAFISHYDNTAEMNCNFRIYVLLCVYIIGLILG